MKVEIFFAFFAIRLKTVGSLKDFFCARHSLSKLNYALAYRKKSTVG